MNTVSYSWGRRALRVIVSGWGYRALCFSALGFRAVGFSVVGFSAVGFSAVGCGKSGVAAGADAPAPNAQAPADEAARPAFQPPDFELDSLSGESVRLSDLVGSKVILLDFWATYCDPCLAAMPHLQKVYMEHRDRGLVILGISIDGPESVANVRSTVAKLGVEFPILLDEESRVVALYNPKTSAPYSVLIGRDGRVRAQQEGFTTGNAAIMEEAIIAALAE